ncbi:hypothetical protein N7530_008667 [Penicillium desertorum]|uniref:Uncharacterized protein n=1 Tax=Penicillium desertorum TaxID=1303715 RepID=A0A9W9WPI4_9EURO|nr:hypothetical protein N7530_008667 [Penicillium desertorum]
MKDKDGCKGKPPRGLKETAELLPSARNNFTTEIGIYDRSAPLSGSPMGSAENADPDSKLPISSKVMAIIKAIIKTIVG